MAKTTKKYSENTKIRLRLKIAKLDLNIGCIDADFTTKAKFFALLKLNKKSWQKIHLNPSGLPPVTVMFLPIHTDFESFRIGLQYFV